MVISDDESQDESKSNIKKFIPVKLKLMMSS